MILQELDENVTLADWRSHVLWNGEVADRAR